MFGGIPFDHFAHGSNMRGGRSSEPADTTKLYETLEVEKSADSKEIKKAFRKLSRVHHPDKGGDEHKFKEINAAYEILSDPEKRAAYDKYGLEGLSDDGAPSAAGEDLFSMFFGGGGRRGGRSGPRRGPSINHPLKVSLEDLYNSKTVKLAVNRKVIVGEVRECEVCRGQGAVMEVRQIAPGMITQMQRPCEACGGQGNIAKTKSERKVLEVHVDKGMKHGQKIVFRGMADERPGIEPGDINFVIQEKDHDLFKRKGADLLVTKQLTLNQALCGFKWKVTHLDGRQLLIQTRPGEIIHAETKDPETGRIMPYIRMVKDEGMPSLGNPFIKGNLYVAFEIQFPESLSAEAVSVLRKVLPGADTYADDDDEEGKDDSGMKGDDDDNPDRPMVEDHFMHPAELKHFGKGGAVSSEYDSEDDDGPQGVQCQQS